PVANAPRPDRTAEAVARAANVVVSSPTRSVTPPSPRIVAAKRLDDTSRPARVNIATTTNPPTGTAEPNSHANTDRAVTPGTSGRSGGSCHSAREATARSARSASKHAVADVVIAPPATAKATGAISSLLRRPL